MAVNREESFVLYLSVKTNLLTRECQEKLNTRVLIAMIGKLTQNIHVFSSPLSCIKQTLFHFSTHFKNNAISTFIGF